MPRHAEHAILPYSADELFAVVAGVKDYPSFVPWCRDVYIQREDNREIIADLVIGFGPFQESFTSHVTLDRPRPIMVRAIEGPQQHLTTTLTFTPFANNTLITFLIVFQLKTLLFNHVPSGISHEPTTRTMSAFEPRVPFLHARQHHANQPPPRTIP